MVYNSFQFIDIVSYSYLCSLISFHSIVWALPHLIPRRAKGTKKEKGTPYPVRPKINLYCSYTPQFLWTFADQKVDVYSALVWLHPSISGQEKFQIYQFDHFHNTNANSVFSTKLTSHVIQHSFQDDARHTAICMYQLGEASQHRKPNSTAIFINL